MDAKLKAKELVEKCYSKYNNVRKDKVYSQEQKRMSNLIVDEILSINKLQDIESQEYWQEVKKEIKSL